MVISSRAHISHYVVNILAFLPLTLRCKAIPNSIRGRILGVGASPGTKQRAMRGMVILPSPVIKRNH